VLPVVAVASREDMAVMLAVHHLVLRETARRYLGRRAKDEMVERCVGQTVAKLLTIQSPSSDHGLRTANKVLWEECRRSTQRQQRMEAPVDRFLGPLTRGPVARALEKLGPRQRRTILLAGQGLTHKEIAKIDKSTPASVRVRLSRARARVNELLREGARSASALLLLAPARLRGVAGRAAPGLVEGIAPQTVATTALVPLIAASLLWSGVDTPTASPAAPVALTPAHGSVLEASTARPAPPPAASTPSPRAERQATAGLAASPAAVSAPAVPLRGAAAETPDDVILKATATPADGRAVIVAIGKGNTCDCAVLMQSLDGGATWAATDGPPASANQVVLPPDYPRDPRIFVGVNPAASAGPYVAAAFGQPYQALSPLPAGQLAVSAHFDDGDPRLFSSGKTAVWSVRLDTSGPLVPRDEIDYSGTTASDGRVAALATPAPSSTAPAVLAWVPAFAVAPGSPSPPTPNPALLRCPMAAPCTTAATLRDSPWQLVVSSHGATVVAYTGTSAFLSRDGGSSFSALALPPEAATIASLALVGPASAPWVSFSRANGSVGVARIGVGVSAWTDASTDSPRLRSYAARLVPVGTNRIIAAFGEVGYRCALAAGGSWLPRCPAA
jgi:DNA-directed RNA polymerase specialized sigma24 family protein